MNTLEITKSSTIGAGSCIKYCQEDISSRSATPATTMSKDESNTREKLVRKSNNITGTPARGLTMEITPIAKKASKQEQDPAKKSGQMKKKGLLDLFGGGPRVTAPTLEGTLIKSLTKRRDLKVVVRDR